MAKELLMPRPGNTVESCVILEFRKKEGDSVKPGDVICEVETDKATFEVPAEDEGVLLKIFYKAGDDVPVLTPLAVIGKPGEDVSAFKPAVQGSTPESGASISAASGSDRAGQAKPVQEAKPAEGAAHTASGAPRQEAAQAEFVGVSPRARHLAEKRGVDYAVLSGTGPGGRVIERDVQAAAEGHPSYSPAALEAKARGLTAPAVGSGIGGRILSSDMGVAQAVQTGAQTVRGGGEALTFPGAITEIPVKSVRKITAERMFASLSTTAQLTLNTSADATAIMEYRKKCKGSPDEMGLKDVTINDLVLFAVSRVLPSFKELNAHFLKEKIVQFEHVHLGFAVDTPRGLMVPVIRFADTLSLKEISAEAKRLGKACAEGKINPDEMTGGTFTVTNLGVLGIESFTPVVNIPQAAILGVNAVSLKPVMRDDEVVFVQHIGFSLTIDHQAVDGAPGARFLKALCQAVAQFDLTLAV